jgi:predicted AAA+ superfamily ATPase
MGYIQFMDTRFAPHNLHLQSPQIFRDSDPNLARLKTMPYVFDSPLIGEFPVAVPGVYSLTGGRQIGKTTLLKQWMLHLLQDVKVKPQNLAFFSGEIIDDHHMLLNLLQQQLATMPGKICYLIIDEVTYIKNWDKAVKYAADAGMLANVVLLLTGSDLVLLQAARKTFPGRRGIAAKVDFHYYPLSFRELLSLKDKLSLLEQPIQHEALLTEFDLYLQHGGYLTAINDLAMHGEILNSTFTTYSDWIRGDMLRRGKQDLYLREIISGVIKRYSSQMSCTWNALAKDLSIEHHKTVADYVDLLQSMDAVYIQSTLQEDKLLPAPKKSKKIMFADPFIYHALNGWLNPVENMYKQHVQKLLSDPELTSRLVETTVVTHYRRKYPTYFISAEGEVDLAYVEHNKFWPIEIKWTQQLRAKDLKQISKYKNSQIFCKIYDVKQVHNIPALFLPYALGVFD